MPEKSDVDSILQLAIRTDGKIKVLEAMIQRRFGGPGRPFQDEETRADIRCCVSDMALWFLTGILKPCLAYTTSRARCVALFRELIMQVLVSRHFGFGLEEEP